MARRPYQAPPDAALWERQTGEGVKAWEAFQMYRDLGPGRSIREAAERLGRSRMTFDEYSARHRWVDRAAAWDNETDRQARKAQLEAVKAMRKRHADLGEETLVKAAAALSQLPEDKISASDIARMIEVGSKLERIARGDVGDVIEARDGGESLPTVTFYMPENSRD